MWFVKMAVGTGQHWTRKVERMGIVTVSEQRPKLVKSLMTAAFFFRLWFVYMLCPLLRYGVGV